MKEKIKFKKAKHNKVIHAMCKRINELSNEIIEIVDEKKRHKCVA
jgi:hypothetical protein